MKVFIVGAGFSKAAGYPLGSEMLIKFEEFVRQPGRAENWQLFWDQFVNWRDTQTDLGVREIIKTGNVELIITYLDLLAEAQDINQSQYYKKGKHLEGSHLERHISERQKELEERRESFSRVGDARRGLVRLLVEYFEHKHCEGREEEKEYYIREFCNQMVNEGDVFITFNYDALLERALYSLGRWVPSDGYGFEVKFIEIEKWKGHEPPRLEKSEVKVLKLHGSVGWYINRSENKIFLNRGRFLQSLIPGIRDAAEPVDTPGQYEHSFVIEPSFIKPFEQKELLDIWDEARSSLGRAREVFIIGYSLPQADAYAQQLIVHSLIANRNLSKVTVVDPNRNTLDRYKKLLGFPINKLGYKDYRIEDWVFSLVSNKGSRGRP
jgi:hypothetical protein